MAESKSPGDLTPVTRGEMIAIKRQADLNKKTAMGWVMVSIFSKDGKTILGSFGDGEEARVSVLSSHPGVSVQILKTGIEVMERDAAEREHQQAVSDVKAAHHVELRGDRPEVPGPQNPPRPKDRREWA